MIQRSATTPGSPKPAETSHEPFVFRNHPDERIEFWGNLPFFFLHAGCALVFFVGISPGAITLFWVTLLVRMFGLTAGYHRYFSHRSFSTSRTFQFVLAVLGSCALQKDPMWWAAHHRHHHRQADKPLDSHSPRQRGFLWSHMGWVMCKKNANIKPDELVPDLATFPELRFLNRHQKIPAFVFLGLLIMVGTLCQNFKPEWGLTIGQSIVWGFFISTIVLHHCTFCVNSLTHMFGSRRFHTQDDSRNNLFVALITLGEGWHNNHHRYSTSERQGFYWWEIDMTHYLLKILSWLGIVWDLRKPPKEVFDEATKNPAKLQMVS